jgi:hypothetical protein
VNEGDRISLSWLELLSSHMNVVLKKYPELSRADKLLMVSDMRYFMKVLKDKNRSIRDSRDAQVIRRFEEGRNKILSYAKKFKSVTGFDLMPKEGDNQ